jgi:hypothetical protein
MEKNNVEHYDLTGFKFVPNGKEKEIPGVSYTFGEDEDAYTRMARFKLDLEHIRFGAKPYTKWLWVSEHLWQTFTFVLRFNGFQVVDEGLKIYFNGLAVEEKKDLISDTVFSE